MHPSRHPLFAAAFALGLAATALPAFAVGARCPSDTPVLHVRSSYQNLILRCHARAQAVPACPPAFPQRVAMPPASGQPEVANPPFGPNRDFCRPLKIIITAPNQVALIVCPAGMEGDTRVGPDMCVAQPTKRRSRRSSFRTEVPTA